MFSSCFRRVLQSVFPVLGFTFAGHVVRVWKNWPTPLYGLGPFQSMRLESYREQVRREAET